MNKLEKRGVFMARLAALLEEAIDGVGTSYNGDGDEVGAHAWCYELSYLPHAKDCWVTKGKALLEEMRKELED